MKKRAITLAIAMTLIMAIFFNACGTSSNSTATGTSGEAETQTTETQKEDVTFWVRGSADDVFSKSIQEDVDLYNASEDAMANVILEFVPMADFATKFNAAFVGGTAPDMMDTGVDQIAIRAHLQQYAPLDEYIDSWQHKDDLYPAYLQAGQMLDDGKTYGIAYSPYPSVFVWRKDFFEQAGLDPETPPQDWDELLEYAEILTEKDGDTISRGGFTIEATGYTLFTMLAQQAGSTLYNAESEPLYNDAGAVEALEFMKEIQPFSITHNPPPGTNVPLPFVSSESAMAFMFVEQVATMLSNDPSLEDKIGVAPFIPKSGGTDVTWCGYRLYAVNEASDVKDAAWDAIEFFMSEERIRAKMESVSMAPAYASLEEDFINMNPMMNGAIIESINVGKPSPKTDWGPSFAGTVITAQQEFLAGDKDAQTALDDAVNTILDDMSLTE